MSFFNVTLAEIPATLGNHALGAAVLAVLVGVVCHRLRHVAVAHALWVVVLLKLLVPSFIPVPLLPSTQASFDALGLERTTFWEPLSFGTAASEVSASEVSASELPTSQLPTSQLPTSQWALVGTTAATTSPPSPQTTQEPLKKVSSLPSWSWLLVLFGGAGTFVVLTLTVVRWRRFQTLLGTGETIPEELEERLVELSQELGLRTPPRLRLVQQRVSPMVWPRWGGTELVLPTALLNNLAKSQLDTVLVHELAHLKRRDHWVRLLELTATAFFWWHPAVWWARRNLRRFEERCCDAWVAQVLPGSGRDYAEGLLLTLELLASNRPLPATASGLNVRQEMKERLTMILKEHASKNLTPWHRGLLAILAVALLVVLPTQAGPAVGDEKDNVKKQEIQQHYAAEEIELERRALALRAEMAEVDAERERLKFERENELFALDAQTATTQVDELRAAGQTVDAELLQLKIDQKRAELELRRRERALNRQHLEDLEPAEREARLLALQLKELKIAGNAEEATVAKLNAELASRRKQLNELQTALENEMSTLHQANFDLKEATIVQQIDVLHGTGRDEAIAKLESHLARLREEKELAAQGTGMKYRFRQAEEEYVKALKLLEEAKHRNDTSAVKQYEAALELMQMERVASEMNEKMRRDKHETMLMTEKIAYRLKELAKVRDDLPAEEKEKLTAEMKALELQLYEAKRSLQAEGE